MCSSDPLLVAHEEENRCAVSAAEDVLFTTFSRELAQRVNLSPRYIDRRANELNEALWRLEKSSFCGTMRQIPTAFS